jgi:hypothetical protein
LLNFIPHEWKNYYIALYPGNFRNIEYSGGDVWDLLINVPQHEYSEVEWKKYVPLFGRGISRVSDRLERSMLLHSSVLPTSIKVSVTSTIGRLEMEQTVYMAIPNVISNVEDKD